MSEQQQSLTITEALAEIKTLSKRISKKRDGVRPYLARVEQMKDPLEADGGSAEFINRERQAAKDMEDRIVELRSAIARANATTTLTVNGMERTIADWLTWRREIAPGQQMFLMQLQQGLENVRSQAQNRGAQVYGAGAAINTDAKPNDIVVNISETELAAEMDGLQETLGQLDGQLSLRNATTTI